MAATPTAGGGGSGVIYSMAIQQGLGAAEILLAGDNAQTRAAYNTAYQKHSQLLNAAMAKNTAEQNMSAIYQDKALTNAKIRQQQVSAEAIAKVSAAYAGVEGGSVDAVKYGTARNEAHAIQAMERKADQAIEQQRSAVYNQQSALLSVDEDDYSILGGLASSFGKLQTSDWQAIGRRFTGVEK